MNKLLRDITLTFFSGLVVGFLSLKSGPLGVSWHDFQNILNDAIRGGILVPLAASLAPFYPEYGVGSQKVDGSTVTAPSSPDYTRPNI